MIPGFNSSVIHAGTEYHVQTEDLGDKNPYILTLVYRGGAIILREKVNYHDALGERPTTAQVRAFMDEQHRRLMGRAAAGLVADAVAGPGSSAPPDPPPSPAPPGAAEQTADELIAAYLRRRKAHKSSGVGPA
jgi:hypothetical protein